jgi:hypothetical protein
MTWIAAAVAACAASISPSQAFTDADLDRLAAEILESKTAPGVGDAINDLSSELIECSAITMVSAICIGKTPGQDSNAGQPLENISSWTGKLGVILGSGVGLSERALSTRLKVTADDIMRDVSSSCRNLSVLFERVRKSCEALVASPTNRLKQILVARQPSLYGKWQRRRWSAKWAACSRLALTAAWMLPGWLANSKIFGRGVAVWIFAPEELCGLDRDGFDVAMGARFAVNEDF